MNKNREIVSQVGLKDIAIKDIYTYILYILPNHLNTY